MVRLTSEKKNSKLRSASSANSPKFPNSKRWDYFQGDSPRSGPRPDINIFDGHHQPPTQTLIHLCSFNPILFLFYFISFYFVLLGPLVLHSSPFSSPSIAIVCRFPDPTTATIIVDPARTGIHSTRIIGSLSRPAPLSPLCD
jgi:hypothetical protein